MDRMEQIAEALHDGWWGYQLNAGYKLGPRDERARTHPHMLPWSQLSEEAKNQDRFNAALILCEWNADIEAGRPKPITPESIHENWCAWETVNESKHPHNQPFEVAHNVSPEEHRWQAERVNELLGRWRKWK